MVFRALGDVEFGGEAFEAGACEGGVQLVFSQCGFKLQVGGDVSQTLRDLNECTFLSSCVRRSLSTGRAAHAPDPF